jgi:hypothetical protein
MMIGVWVRDSAAMQGNLASRSQLKEVVLMKQKGTKETLEASE